MADLRDFTGKNRKFTGTEGIVVSSGTTAQRPGAILITLDTITGGTGGTPGTYDIEQTSTTGSGTGTKVRAVVDGSSTPTITILNGGTGHTVSDVITFGNIASDGSTVQLGGATDITINVASISSDVTLTTSIVRFNTDTSNWEGYDGTNWTSLAGGDTQIRSLGVGTEPSFTSGEIRATNAITSFFSDERLKENIEIIDSALEKLNTIKGVTYNSNSLAENYGYKNKEKQVGVLAGDVEKVLPEAVKPAPFDILRLDENTEISRSGENFKTVQYEKIVPLLVEAIKELKIKVEKLEKNNGTNKI